MIAACGDFGEKQADKPETGFEPGADGGAADGADGSTIPVSSLKATVVDEGYVVQGVATPVRVRVVRAGFSGPVKISLGSLPTGATAVPALLPAGTDVGEIIVTVPTVIPQGPVKATLRAASEDDSVTDSTGAALFVRGKPGTADLSFGAGGVADVPFDAQYVEPWALAMDGQGRVVVGVRGGLVRLTSDGLRDSSFGSNGVVAEVNPQGGRLEALDAADDGRIMVATSLAGPQQASRLLRLLTNGSRDTSFGVNGSVVPQYAGLSTHRPRRCVMLNDGGVVVAETAGSEWLVSRFDANGALDTKFANAGFLHQAWPPAGSSSPVSEISTLSIDASGSVVLAGMATYGAEGSRGDEMAITRILPGGAIDMNFLGTGTARVPFSSASNRRLSRALDGRVLADSRVVVLGMLAEVALSRRLDTKGQVDLSFGVSGLLQAAPFDPSDGILAGIIADDGKPILLGSRGSNVVVRRLNVDATTDNRFGDGLLVLGPGHAGKLIDASFVAAKRQRLAIAASYNNEAATATTVTVYRLWL